MTKYSSTNDNAFSIISDVDIFLHSARRPIKWICGLSSLLFFINDPISFTDCIVSTGKNGLQFSTIFWRVTKVCLCETDVIDKYLLSIVISSSFWSDNEWTYG